MERADLLCRIGTLRGRGCSIPFNVDILTNYQLSAVYKIALKKFEDSIELSNYQRIGVSFFLIMETMMGRLGGGFYSSGDCIKDIEYIEQTTKIAEVNVHTTLRASSIREAVVNSHQKLLLENKRIVLSILDILATNEDVMQKTQNLSSLLPQYMVLLVHDTLCFYTRYNLHPLIFSHEFLL